MLPVETVRLFQLFQELHASEGRRLLPALVLEVFDLFDDFLDLLVDGHIFLRLRLGILLTIGQGFLRLEGHLGNVVHDLGHHWHLDAHFCLRLPLLNGRQRLRLTLSRPLLAFLLDLISERW